MNNFVLPKNCSYMCFHNTICIRCGKMRCVKNIVVEGRFHYICKCGGSTWRDMTLKERSKYVTEQVALKKLPAPRKNEALIVALKRATKKLREELKPWE